MDLCKQQKNSRGNSNQLFLGGPHRNQRGLSKSVRILTIIIPGSVVTMDLLNNNRNSRVLTVINCFWGPQTKNFIETNAVGARACEF